MTRETTERAPTDRPLNAPFSSDRWRNARRCLVVTQLLLAAVCAAFGLAGVPREEQIGLAPAAPIENVSAALGLVGVPREEQTGVAQAAPIQTASAASGLAGAPEEEQTGLAQAAPIESASAASGLPGVLKEEQTGLTQAAPIESASYRVAVLTAGTVQRFHVYPIPQSLIAPLVQEGHTVDYFLALNTEAFSSWTPHAEGFRIDPAIVSSLELNDDTGAIELNTNITAPLVDLVNASIRQAGGALRGCTLYGDALGIFDSILQDKRKMKAMSDWTQKAPGWWRTVGARRDAARGNIMKLLKQIEDLWYQIVLAEAERGRYDFVITQRDDSFWLRPFSLNTLLASPPETHAVDFRTRQNARAKPRPHPRRAPHSQTPPEPPKDPHRVARAFNQRCLQGLSSYDAKTEGGYSDGILILRREVAEPFGTMFSRLLSKRLYWRLWNIERFIKVTADEGNVTFASMPAGLIPVQRAGRLSVNGVVRVCLHYFCDSAAGPIKELKPQERFPACSQVFDARRAQEPRRADQSKHRLGNKH